MDECDEVAVWLLTDVQACWRCGDTSGVVLGVDVAGIGVVDAGEDLCESSPATGGCRCGSGWVWGRCGRGGRTGGPLIVVAGFTGTAMRC